MSQPDTLPPYRAKLAGEYSPAFNGYLYFGFANLAALAGIITGFALLENVRPYEWLTIPLAFLFANVAEWLAHKGPMHNRRDAMELLFDRHTLVHHHYFPHKDMAVGSHHEWGYILFPWWAILLVYVAIAPVFALLWFALSPNVACLFLATGVGYYLLYEWLHLLYHLPDNHPVGGLAIVKKLRRHHYYHHHTKLMLKHNFNVTFPLSDYVFGTAYRAHELPAEPDTADAEPQSKTA